MPTSRDQEAWSYIFKLYKGLPYLWDKNNINFGNKDMIRDGYKVLTRVYRQKLDKEASAGALRMKMKNIRTTYYRELSKIKEAKRKGDRYTPSLWYFEHLSFLRSSKSNKPAADISQNDFAEDLMLMQDFNDMEKTQPTNVKALDKSDKENKPVLSTPQPEALRRTELEKISISPVVERQDHHVVDSNEISLKDEYWKVIGKSIEYQLRDLNKIQYTIASKLISDAIYFGRLNKLTEVSHIETGSSSLSHPQYSQLYRRDDTSRRVTQPPVHFNTEIHDVDVPTDAIKITLFKNEEHLNEI